MENKKITQLDRVLRHLKNHRGLTTYEAFKEYGITRLSAKIFSLRKRGFNIYNEEVYARNRYGEPVRFVRYRLDKENKGFWNIFKFLK